MKKMLHKEKSRKSARISQGRDYPGHAPSATDRAFFERAVWVKSPASQRPDEWIAGQPVGFFVGKLVSVPCQTECGLVEHLNIRVVAIDDNALVGDLDGAILVASELAGVTRVKVTPAQVVWVRQTLEQWRSAVARLQKESDYHNPWRGTPTGWQFDGLYAEGHSPLSALTMWRDWEPWEEYTPPYDESWPPHDDD